MKTESLEVFYRPFKKANPREIFFQDIKAKKIQNILEHSHNGLLDAILANDFSRDEIPLETTHQEFLDLYTSMKVSGFDSENPVKIAIDQQGIAVVVDGLHRLVCAIKLGFAEVPVQVVYRAIEWQLLKHAMYQQSGNTYMYQEIPHFDFEGWTRWRVDNQKRADLISEFLSKKGVLENMRGIEIACNSGCVTNALSRLGVTMIGLDVDPYCVETANRLSEMRFIGGVNEQTGKKLASFALCGYDVNINEYESVDFIICLSLLNHHQVDGRDLEGRDIFKRLTQKADTIFIDCPTEGDPVGGHSAFTDPQKVIDWCVETCGEGCGFVLADHRENKPLMRTLIVWQKLKS